MKTKIINYLRSNWPTTKLILTNFWQKGKETVKKSWKISGEHSGIAAILGAIAGHGLSNIGTTKKLEDAKEAIEKSRKKKDELREEIKDIGKREKELDLENKQLQNYNIQLLDKNNEINLQNLELKDKLKDCQLMKNFHKIALEQSWCLWKKSVPLEDREKIEPAIGKDQLQGDNAHSNNRPNP